MEREPNTQYVLSLSYGKDSLATIEACKRLGYPIDRIIHAEIWATDDISADLPPMVEFKKKADAIIKERYGIEVEHVCATAKDGSKQTYEKLFYHVPKRRAERERERESNPRISSDQRKLVYLKSQADSLAVSPSASAEGIGVQDSNKMPLYRMQGTNYGFPPTAYGAWCRKLKLNPQTNSFQIGSP